MKKIFTLLAIAAFTMLATTSCVSTEKIVYFQGSEQKFESPQKIMQQYEMRLKPADQVLIKVTCSEPKLLQIFAQDLTMGTLGTNSSSMNMSSSGSMSNAYGYTVTNNGELILPAVGKVKVDGTTVEECATAIENRIKELGLIPDPEVTVRLLNARVTVVGAVHGPKVVNLSSERNTIVDVLAQCGDIDDTGLRYKVKLYREEGGELKMYELDMTKSELFESPAYYVQQNDMIYVEHNKSKRVKSSPFYTSLSAWSSIVGVVTTCVSLIFLIVNNSKK